MKFSILIPHYKTARMTAYCIHQIMKCKGRHEVDVYVINNSGDAPMHELLKESAKYPEVIIIDYPSDRMQSHGLAFDYVLDTVFDRITDYFITLESDSFPCNANWLDTYAGLIGEGYDMAGSLLNLSGGEYIHPAGAMYGKSNWMQAKQDVKNICKYYDYYPNMLKKDGFYSHTMIRIEYGLGILGMDFHHTYKTEGGRESNLNNYIPIAQSVFHNGQGFNQESYLTYGKRNWITGMEDFVPREPAQDIIYRMGYEPGQWFYYWHRHKHLKYFEIPTEVQWMPNRVNQQQEYTLTQNGVKHLWGVSAYADSEAAEVQDIRRFKSLQVEQLYQSIL